MVTYQRPSVLAETPACDRPDLVMEWLRFLQTLEDMYVSLAEAQFRPYQRAGGEELMQRARAAAETGDHPGDVCGHGMFWPQAGMSGSPSRPVVGARATFPPC